MPAEDISRHLFDPRLRYTAALMQQGRVLTDADWNEMVRLADHDRRTAMAETVCTQGSPNDGLRIGTPSAAAVTIFPTTGAAQSIGSYDFSIGAGSFYLGGYRFEHGVETAADTFLQQADALDFTLGGTALPRMPTAAELAAGPRTDLVYLHGWHQAVTSIEDQEFRERALGGPDTTTRLRRMRRVEVLSGVTAADCAAARAALQTALAAPRPGDTSGVPHAFDAEGTALRSKARLTVSFPGGSDDSDACKPRTLAGYIGAENQALRVQLTAANRFVWGLDNGAPLYRVQLDPGDPTRLRIRFLTVPRDQAAMPLAGQAVELLPWQARLANGEKVAAASGFISAVATSYDPDTQSLTLQNAVPAHFAAWLAALPASVENPMDPAGQRRFLLLRLWTGGPDQAFVPGTAVTLPGTGLALTFSAPGVAEDYWVVAARPFTPEQVVPWRLLEQAPPHGPQRLYAALALVTWSASGGGVSAHVHDCRERFRSLCRSHGCCRYIVGDGIESFGDFSSIQAAIEALPEAGGEVCVLHGTYAQTVSIDGRRNVTLHGCGPDTRLVPTGAMPGLSIRHCEGVTVRDLALEAPAVTGIEVGAQCRDITLCRLELQARDTCAIRALVLQGLVIEDCVLRAQALLADLVPGGTVGVMPLLFAGGDDLRIERNTLDATAADTNRRRAPGGVQIAGGSTQVQLRRNRIRGGNGNGITLGSLHYVPQGTGVADGALTGALLPTPAGWVFDPNGCILVPGEPDTPKDPAGNPMVPVSDGDLLDVRILDNDIDGMGRNGIAAVQLLVTGQQPELVSVEQLEIAGNRLLRCMRIEAAPIAVAALGHTAFGGIVLSDVTLARIADNVIEEVGTEFHDPICAIFALRAEGIVLSGNRLRRNGRVAQARAASKPGLRGGIVLRLALAPTESLGFTLGDIGIKGLRQDGMPAAVVHGNVVVAREGRALSVMALGAVAVADNQFTAHGSDFLALLRQRLAAEQGTPLAGAPAGAAAGLAGSADKLDLLLDALGGSVVLVVDLGWSNEFYTQLLGPPQGSISRYQRQWLVGGPVLFNDNQVNFDALEPVFSFSLCAVLLFSYDQVTMNDNQVACDLALDFVIVNSMAVGVSVQAQGNRFTEGVFNAYLSGMTVGLMNSTALNVGTHCILDLGTLKPQALANVSGGGTTPPMVDVVLRLNVALVDAMGRNEQCRVFERLLPARIDGWKYGVADLAAVPV